MYKLFIVLIILSVTPSYSSTLTVCKTCNFKTVKSAITAAGENDTIIIKSGSYAEGNILIDKPLYIKGLGHPVLDGNKKNEVVTIKSDNVTITGLQIQNSGSSSMEDLAGIKLLKVRNALITGNILVNNNFGIYLYGSSQCTIKNNKVSASGTIQQTSGNGIHLWKSNNIKILDNEIKGHRDGIYFEFVTASLIKGNLSETNLRYGLHFMFSDGDTYENNTFRNNGAGVAVMYTKNVRMYNNKFILNWGSGSYAILLKDISDSEIRGNEFNGNTTGISAEGSTRVKIISNQFTSNGWAIKLTSSCDKVELRKNNFSGNTFDMTTNGSSFLTMNTIEENYWDKYQGYDLDKNNIGDIPYHPVSLSNLLVEKIPPSVYFLHSFVLDLIDSSEKLIPSLTPEDITDKKPSMKKHIL